MKRRISFKNANNVRDLGGLKTESGKALKSGLLIRSNHLSYINNKEIEKLKGLGIKTIIDLRTPNEVIEKPDVIIDGVKNINIAIVNDSLIGLTFEKENDKKKILNNLPDFNNFYRMLASNDYCISKFSEALHTVMASTEPTLWHCTQGKDRCGILSVLIETILGVCKKDIYDDYLYTNKVAYKTAIKYCFLSFLVTKKVAIAKKAKNVFLAKKEYLDSYYEEIESKYGSMENFITNKLKISDEEIETFKKRMLY